MLVYVWSALSMTRTLTVPRAGVMPGDIIFVIKELPHDRFRRVGTDLFMKKRLSLRDALCGCSFTFKHLDGRNILVKVRASVVLS